MGILLIYKSLFVSEIWGIFFSEKYGIFCLKVLNWKLCKQDTTICGSPDNKFNFLDLLSGEYVVIKYFCINWGNESQSETENRWWERWIKALDSYKSYPAGVVNDDWKRQSAKQHEEDIWKASTVLRP